MPLLDPDPVQRDQGRQRRAAARTTSRRWSAPSSASAPGELEKIVLAREVRAHAATPHDPAAVLGRAARRLPGLLLLVRRHPRARLRRREPRAARAPRRRPRPDGGARRHHPPQRRPVRGRPPRRAAAAQRQGPRGAGDRRAAHRADARAGQRVGHGRRRPRPGRRSRTSSISPRRSGPSWPIPLPAVELAGMLLPTPAVGGEPREAALPLIPALEGLDRGWYAGAVGWTDLARGRRVLRRAALRAAARSGGASVCGLWDRARFGSRRGAGGKRGQARSAVAAALVAQRPDRVMAPQGGVEGRR